ncbi:MULTISPECIES: hypothetical protein [unclassified Halomonas]|uniref:hypothetical protein n=1 Tax=unclassified Halomonas TaxID=2609666 RepID=UPI002885BC5E|nr:MULTISPECIES: hypothetical protein [unclassified Halomonas]MDT0502099.1 hypothetical protein [Halomonas sp. PAR7]MDT0510891.1 hypothetical protein [Halomonas sp. LES1]MDT0592785.1 hypothetical protein [Halomonas sp. PAR8]
MPITESMSLLWLSYGVLSLVILLTGYLGLAFLPRLLRLPITWLVAGVMWMPARFQLPLLEEGDVYTGFAPAVVVATVAFLERNSEALMPALILTLLGAGLGMLFGLLLWWRGRRPSKPVTREEHESENKAADGPRGAVRREPVIGQE